jgi:hypothetical protein
VGCPGGRIPLSLWTRAPRSRGTGIAMGSMGRDRNDPPCLRDWVAWLDYAQAREEHEDEIDVALDALAESRKQTAASDAQARAARAIVGATIRPIIADVPSSGFVDQDEVAAPGEDGGITSLRLKRAEVYYGNLGDSWVVVCAIPFRNIGPGPARLRGATVAWGDATPVSASSREMLSRPMSWAGLSSRSGSMSLRREAALRLMGTFRRPSHTRTLVVPK